MAPKGKVSDPSLIEQFLDMIAAERGGSTNTLDAYARDLAHLSAALNARRRSIADAETEDLRIYFGSLAARGLAPASVGRRLSAIRQLFRFLHSEGRRRNDPSAVLEGPRRMRAPPKVLSMPKSIASSRTPTSK